MKYFILLAVFALSGCSTSPMYGEGMMNAYQRETNYRYAMRSAPYGMMMPVEASGCDLTNPLAICLKNTTDAYQARCWVSEIAQPFVTPAGAAQAPIAIQRGGVGPAYLIPPRRAVPVGIHPSGREYHLKCQLFRGTPPDDFPPYIATHEENWSFQYNGQEGRTFHLHPDFMRPVRGLPAN